MNVATHDDSIRYLVSFADEMISESEKDQQHRTILLNLAELHLKNLIKLYESDKTYCFAGYIYQKLGWVKYRNQNFLSAEKNFLYSIVNLKNCEICVQELLESYWGLVNTYINLNKIKLAKQYFLTYYEILSCNESITIEQDIDAMIKTLDLSAEDFLK